MIDDRPIACAANAGSRQRLLHHRYTERLVGVVKQLDAEDLALLREMETLRPRTRGDCRNAPRPCPWVSCRYHLAVDHTAAGLRIARGGEDPTVMRETCVLDVADRGGVTTNEVAAITGYTRQRISKIERQAIAKLREAGVDLLDLPAQQPAGGVDTHADTTGLGGELEITPLWPGIGGAR